MDIGIVSVRYAKALLGYATECKQDDVVYQEMTRVATTYQALPALGTALLNPVLSDEDKLRLLCTAAAEGGNCSATTQRFYRLLLEKKREDMMQFIAGAFISLYREQKHITSGKLTVASPVSPATEERMRKMVEGRIDSKVDFEVIVNPDIVGGFVLEYDTYRMDASLKGQLDDLRRQLL